MVKDKDLDAGSEPFDLVTRDKEQGATVKVYSNTCPGDTASEGLLLSETFGCSNSGRLIRLDMAKRSQTTLYQLG